MHVRRIGLPPILLLASLGVLVAPTQAGALPAISVDQSSSSSGSSFSISTSQNDELILIAANGWPSCSGTQAVTVDGSPATEIASASDCAGNAARSNVFYYVAPSSGSHSVVVSEGGYSSPVFVNFAASILNATNVGLTFNTSSNTDTTSITTPDSNEYLFGTTTFNTNLSATGTVTWSGSPVTPVGLQSLHAHGLDSAIAGAAASSATAYSIKADDSLGNDETGDQTSVVVALEPGTPPVTTQTITMASTASTTFDQSGTYNVNATSNDPGATLAYTIDGIATDTAGCSANSSGNVSFTSIGTCTIDVNSAATSGYGAAAQAQQVLTVSKASPSINLLPPTGPFAAGQSGAFSGQISGGGTPFNGTLTLSFWPTSACNTGTNPYPSQTFNPTSDGTHTFAPTGPFNAGTFYALASYGGDSNNFDAASTCTAVTVNQASPTLTANAPREVAKGSYVRFGVTIGSGDPPFTGSIALSFYYTASCTGRHPYSGQNVVPTTDGSYLSRPIGPMVSGTYFIHAVYGGDANNSSVTSSCVAFHVA